MYCTTLCESEKQQEKTWIIICGLIYYNISKERSLKDRNQQKKKCKSLYHQLSTTFIIRKKSLKRKKVGILSVLKLFAQENNSKIIKISIDPTWPACHPNLKKNLMLVSNASPPHYQETTFSSFSSLSLLTGHSSFSLGYYYPSLQISSDL